MAKYIDAERLKAEIERRKQSLRAGICSDDAFTKEQKKEMLVASEEIDRFNSIVTSLQQEQPETKKMEGFIKGLCTAGANYQEGYFDGYSAAEKKIYKDLKDKMEKYHASRVDYGVHIEHEPTDHHNRKVLLCDLDGTLIVTKSGKTFPVDENDWQFKDGVKEAIQNYNPRYIFIVTNQGGIEKGYVGESSFFQKFKTIIENIRTWGDYIVDGVYCTSTDKNSWFRKPNVGMIDYFRNDWTQRYNFNNEDALMIGDMETDQECAKNAGISYLDVEEFIRLNKEVSDNVDKLRAISTLAEEDWFKISEEWEKEDKQTEKDCNELKNVHDLKILPEYFQAVKSGEKTFEIRFNDRNFQKGDMLHLREWDGNGYTGESIFVEVTYILNDPGFCKDGYVIMAIIKKEDKKSATLRDELIESSWALSYEIDRCITDLLLARFDKDDQHEREELSRMESLMVQTQQHLSCITDYLEREDKE